MPTQERSLRRDEPPLGGNQSHDQRQHREAMARNTSPQGSSPRADAQPSQWDDAAWPQDHDEAACNRARRLLSRSNSTFHRFGDHLGALRRWLAGERWVKRLAVVVAALMVIFAGCFGGLWWRLGAGPINLEMATPWLAAAIEENIGHGNTVEVGGTQIERAGRIRIAVRIRDIIVRDRDHVVVATAPKAEVKLSGTALLMGQLRAESLNLVDAELAVRITPDGYVTVSTGDTERPLATGVASKRQAGGTPPLAQGTAAVPAPAAPPSPGAAQSGTASTAPGSRDTTSGLLAGLDWLDSLSLTGLEERKPDRRRSAARQQMEFREYQPQSSPAERRRGGVAGRRGRQPCLVASRRGRSSGQRRAIGRHSRRQGLDDEYPAGAAVEGPDL